LLVLLQANFEALEKQRIKEEGALWARWSDRISVGVESGFRRRLLRRSGRQRTGLCELRGRCRHHSRSGRRLEWPGAAASGKRESGTDQRKSKTIIDQSSPKPPVRGTDPDVPFRQKFDLRGAGAPSQRIDIAATSAAI
jgi:hypothetical protein